MINFTQGDTAVLALTATNGNGDPIDLTGASFTTYVRAANGSNATFPNSQHTADPDQVANRGKFQLALSSVDTAACGQGENKMILSRIVISSTVIYYRGVDVLNVYPPVPIQ